MPSVEETGTSSAAGPRADREQVEAGEGVFPLLRLDRVTKFWGRRRRGRPVLEGVDLHVPAGTAAWIGGRNGAGKTTLLRLAGGLLAADEGRVAVDGLDPESDRREYQRRIGFLSAGDRGLYPRLTVARHLGLWARLAFVGAEGRRDAVAGAVARFGLDPLLAARVDRLSLGQRQRLRLALTFLHDPDVVLLDEPRNSLDEDGIALLGRALAAHKARGGVLLWCSPRMDFDPSAFERAHVIAAGRLEDA